MYNPHDTICASSTPPGEGALAIVRLSGERALEIIKGAFRGGELKNRLAAFGEIIDHPGQTLDQVVVIWYKAPRSYTGEDLIEIICHGGYVASQQIQSLLCAAGARLAEPGEFTLRAFLNGRIDLTEAEAVDSVIRAKTAGAKQLAIQNLEGRLRTSLERIDSLLFELITILEAEIDFHDDEINKLDRSVVTNKINEITPLLKEIMATYDIGRIAEGRGHIAIIGAPNVGKSSLFNAIIKQNRAIVTPIPGTTRDYISEYVNIGGFPVILTDTAGIRNTDETIEIIGINKSRDLIDDVDLCLFVLDCSRPLQAEDLAISEILNNHKRIILLNKSDLDKSPATDYEAAFSSDEIIHISAVTGAGINGLIEEIRLDLIGGKSLPDNGVLLSQRQFQSSVAALESLARALAAVEAEEPEEIIVSLLRESLDHIGEITGKVTSEEILNQIFSEFCIGK